MEIIKHFVITEIFEIAIALVIGIREKKNIWLIFIVNVITNIPLNLFLTFVARRQVLYLSAYTGIDIFTWYYIITFVLEIIILFVEASIYFKLMDLSGKCIFYKLKGKYIAYFIISLILNLSSVVGGRLLD